MIRYGIRRIIGCLQNAEAGGDRGREPDYGRIMCDRDEPSGWDLSTLQFDNTAIRYRHSLQTMVPGMEFGWERDGDVE